MDKAHLFLSGGGDEKQTKKFDKAFAASLPKKKRILYIPVAMPPEKYTPDQCFGWIKNCLGAHGITRIDMWTDISQRKPTDLQKYGAVYVGGGNTFYLLKTIRETGFDELLLKYHKNGGILYGGSAGAVIMGKDITTAYFGLDKDKNLAGLTDFKGLNIAGGYSIATHYTSQDDKALFNYVKKLKIDVICLPEETGLHIKDGRWKVIGLKDAYLFTKKGKSTLKVGIEFKRDKKEKITR